MYNSPFVLFDSNKMLWYNTSRQQKETTERKKEEKKRLIKEKEGKEQRGCVKTIKRCYA